MQDKVKLPVGIPAQFLRSKFAIIFGILAGFLNVFKKHQDQFKEIKDRYNKIHLYVNQTIIDGTYYCYQHLQYDDVMVEKRGGSECSLCVPEQHRYS